MVNKRKFEDAREEPVYEDGDCVRISSLNCSPLAWGFKGCAIRLSIVGIKSHHQIFRLKKSSASGKSFYLAAVGPLVDGKWLTVETDSRDVILSHDRTLFYFEVIEIVGCHQIVRICTKDKFYVRHANYFLSADPERVSDRPWAEDTQWLMTRISPDNVSTAPPSPTALSERKETAVFNRPLFIHLESCFADKADEEQALSILYEFIHCHIVDSAEKPRHSPEKTLSYLLQGAGGMGMRAADASAISMTRPGPAVSSQLKVRIEEAITVKSRGGVASFIKPTNDVADIVSKLAAVAIREMKRLRMFGMVSRREFELELGFAEWVTLPNGSEIVPHRDGGNDCDVAAIFCFHNRSQCTVEGTSITLREGQMYIFEPQKYFHSVGKPQDTGPRHVIALRFFRTIAPDNGPN